MQTDRFGGRLWPIRWQRLAARGWFSIAVKLKPKRPAECAQRPFGVVGFRSLECNVVNLARRAAMAFAGAAAFPD